MDSEPFQNRVDDPGNLPGIKYRGGAAAHIQGIERKRHRYCQGHLLIQRRQIGLDQGKVCDGIKIAIRTFFKTKRHMDIKSAQALRYCRIPLCISRGIKNRFGGIRIHDILPLLQIQPNAI